MIIVRIINLEFLSNQDTNPRFPKAVHAGEHFSFCIWGKVTPPYYYGELYIQSKILECAKEVICRTNGHTQEEVLVTIANYMVSNKPEFHTEFFQNIIDCHNIQDILE